MREKGGVAKEEREKLGKVEAYVAGGERDGHVKVRE